MSELPSGRGEQAELPTVTELLTAAVDELGGTRRDGQLAMASAVANAIDTGEHLAVQAGTGTGKSLAYLVPAIRHAVETGRTVLVSTATIALQRQLIDRDLPRLAAALAGPLGRTPTIAILKGRGNYLCLNKIHSGTVEEPDGELFDAFTISAMGREITRLRDWTSDTETGDRDDLDPGVGDRAWRQVSVTARECLGAHNCSYGTDCFAERARQTATRADVVVTNHALLAINALSPADILPEHDVVIVDEAHELADRITSVATAEVSAASIALLARRCGKLIEDEQADNLADSGELVGDLLDELPATRWTRLPTGAPEILAALRDRLAEAHSAIGPVQRGAAADPEAAAARSAALTGVDELRTSVVRILDAFSEPDEAKRADVVWVADEPVSFRSVGKPPSPGSTGDRRKTLRVAPLSVGGLLRASLFANATVVLTSATLTVGGTFDALAATWGLPAGGGSDAGADRDVTATGKAAPAEAIERSARWQGLDVGSPFAHQSAAILYVAKHLPAPGRDGLGEPMLAELAELIGATGGRTLGLFSSMRAAKEAAEALRDRMEMPILCQGDDATGALVRRFAEDEPTCLFGTLSLWQGVDVPGPACSLVTIDRIPFPRPDDPLLTARQRAVESRGGNGFMSVAANHAALLLAQGTGRLLRATDDRGVVAVLDSRLATARYGSYLLASLPPFWRTTDPAAVRSALERLSSADESAAT